MPTPPKIERVDWKELGPEFLNTWGMPGGKFSAEHLAILGPTGSGKSFFMTYALKQRAELRGSHVVVLATKPADSTITNLKWPIINKWPPRYDQSQVVFWPKAGRLNESLQAQRQSVLDMMDELWHANSNIILAFDEIAYLEAELKLTTPITRYWREARALGITIVAATQRPRYVSRYMFNESSWAVAFRPTDEDDANRVGEILGSKKNYKEILMDGLNPHEFLLIHRSSRSAYISKIPNVKTTSSSTTGSRETRKTR